MAKKKKRERDQSTEDVGWLEGERVAMDIECLVRSH